MNEEDRAGWFKQALKRAWMVVTLRLQNITKFLARNR